MVRLERDERGAGAGDEVHVFQHNHGRLEKAGELHVFVQHADLFRRDEQCGMVRQLTGEVVNRMRLAGSGRTVKEQALLDAHAESVELVPLLDEFRHVLLQQYQTA